MQVFFYKIDGNLDDVFVSHFISSDVRNVSGGPRTRRNVFCNGLSSHCACVPEIETSGMHSAYPFLNFATGKKRLEVQKTLELSKDSREASDSLVEVAVARDNTAVTLGTRNTLAA